jgi:hypothetical protein
MTPEQLKQKFDELSAKQKEVLLKKNSDYAQQDEDALSNFKLAGAISGITPQIQALSLIGVKVARLGVLLHGKEAKNESIEDSILDLANYAFLLYAIQTEGK